jgi:hypothetical protein
MAQLKKSQILELQQSYSPFRTMYLHWCISSTTQSPPLSPFGVRLMGPSMPNLIRERSKNNECITLIPQSFKKLGRERTIVWDEDYETI